jgi:hypothetical protein
MERRKGDSRRKLSHTNLWLLLSPLTSELIFRMDGSNKRMFLEEPRVEEELISMNNLDQNQE